MISFWPTAFLLSLVFAAAHGQHDGETAIGLAQVTASGLMFSLLLRASGSLWLGISFHAAWDWAQSFLYGTPDSGVTLPGHFFLRTQQVLFS